MAGRGGARTGAGRKAGGTNRATLEKAALAERIMAEAAAARGGGKPGALSRKLGTEVMGEYMELFQSISAAAQPTTEEASTPAALLEWLKTDRGKVFTEFSERALKAAADLSEFQQPKFGRVQTTSPPPPPQQVRKKFTISIFDNQGRPAPRHLDVKAIEVKTAKAASQAKH